MTQPQEVAVPISSPANSDHQPTAATEDYTTLTDQDQRTKAAEIITASTRFNKEYHFRRQTLDRDMLMLDAQRLVLTEAHFYRQIGINPAVSINERESLVTIDGQSHDLIYVPSENRFHTKIETFLYIQNITGAPNTKGIYWLVKTKDGTVLGQCQADGSGGIECLTTSDIRRKKDIANDTDIESDKLNTIRIVKYKAADGGSDKVATGVIAQELAEIYSKSCNFLLILFLRIFTKMFWFFLFLTSCLVFLVV